MGDTPQYPLTVIYKDMVEALATSRLIAMQWHPASSAIAGWIRDIQVDPKSSKHLKLDWSDTSFGFGNLDE